MTTFDPVAHAALDCGYGHACAFCAVESTCELDKPKHNARLLERRLGEIGQVIMVLANKGGVGKSTVAANLAAALAHRGFRVGLGDADIHGPNAAKLLGVHGHRVKVEEVGITPPSYAGSDDGNVVRVGSLHFFLAEDDSPVVWRDAYKFDYVHHMVGSYDWGTLDFFVLDMPPGTGNELITLCDLLEGQALTAVLVTTPQAVALLDALKAARFCRERGVPVAGVVENMAGMVCPHCKGEIEVFPRDPLAASLGPAGLEVLAQLPLSPALAFGSDAGAPIVDRDPDSVEARQFLSLAERFIASAKAAQGDLAVAQVADGLMDEDNRAVLAEALSGLPENAETADVRRQLQELLDGEHERLVGEG